MIVAVALFAAALVLGFGAPRWLPRLAAPGTDPRLALVAWVSTQVLFVSALVGGPLAVVTRPGLWSEQIPLLAASCVRTARDEGLLPWLPYAETALWTLAGALLVRIALVVGRSYRRHRRDSAAHLNLVRILGEARTSGEVGEVVWLREKSCAAYSVGGRNGIVVASEGLSVLAPLERRAVLAHEYAHIRGRHHVLVMFGGALAAALPFVPLCREGAAWVRVFVELAADRRAAHVCGHEAVRDALIRCSARSSTPDPSSHRFVDDRLRWLSRAPRPEWSRRVLAYPLALTVSALPALLTGVSVIGIVAASCLTV
ncbi:M56 family metallopeptidase [Rhodococcus sp. DMU1]|uniref:M56 family metallopeptidase n=1 Tax=Rhodococcus sp. DMU1 TaxID=2722825 RepID=UPI00143E269A|nr:M56 family metallopeptidase [Rhodococcus sp. DMU1]QIX52816.1 M56 family metallopeptidase [Rhodococcus sp. DMU1]